MNLETKVLELLAAKPASGGRLIERLQAEGTGLLAGRGAVVYGVLANLNARGEVVVVSEGAGERVWGRPDGPAVGKAAPPGFPPSFSLGAPELEFVDRELARMTKGVGSPHYFEELRRAVVADADRRVFHGEKLPRAVHLALGDLGPPGGVRPFLLRVEKGGPVALRMHPAPRRRWLLLPLGLLALLFLARMFLVGVYTVPADSASMAPTLFPAVEGGDALVLADLLAYRTGKPARGEVAILGLGDDLLVKRIMGLPGETISVKDEDLFVNGERYVKGRDLLDRLKVPLRGLDDYERRETSPAGWFPPPKPLGAVYPLPGGGWDGDAGRLVRDVIVTARVRFADMPATITFEIDDGRSAPPVVMIEYGGTGSASVGGIEFARGEELSVEAGAELEVWISNADRMLRVEVDGRLVGEPTPIRREPRPVQLRVLSYGPVELLDLEVARDVFYTSSGRKPVTLGDGEYFVLGDNSPRSRDSRAFGAIDRAQLVGRVFAVIWPTSRARYVR